MNIISNSKKINFNILNSKKYYSNYPKKIILRPGYPARAQFKSTLMWSLFNDSIIKEIGKIKTYADIGGCFGFGANSMAFQIQKYQNYYPETFVFEISSEFITTGKILFPNINFIKGEFGNYNKKPKIFDLITLFDVLEHIPNPKKFLQILSKRAKLIMLNTPMETSGDWFGSLAPIKQGIEHEDGHINFFSPNSYVKLLEDSGFKIIKSKLVQHIIPHGAEIILSPEYIYKEKFIKRILPFNFSRKFLGGGNHLCIIKPR